VSILKAGYLLESVYIDIEYCELSLDEYVTSKKTGIPGLPDWTQAEVQGQRDFIVLAIIQQVLSGLASIHNSGVEHGCLTMNNGMYRIIYL